MHNPNKWDRIPSGTKLKYLEAYRQGRSIHTIIPLATEVDMLPQTLMRRLQEMDRETGFVPAPEETEIFPDKKQSNRSYAEVTRQIREIQHYHQEKSVSQDEATWQPQPDYPDLPIAFTWMCDIHYGSLETDYDLLDEHLSIINNTPNMYAVFGGDEIDNFNAFKYADGIWHDAVSPEDQIVAWAELIIHLDKREKVGAIVWGNHTEFTSAAGISPYSAFFNQVSCPIFQDGGGVLNIIVGGVRYRAGIRHTFWGGSKINITNSPKKLLQNGYPNLDMALVGHVHTAGGEQFTQAGEEKIAVTGGTYKTMDTFRKRWDGDPHPAGFTILLSPHTKHMQLCRTPQDAQNIILGAIAQYS